MLNETVGRIAENEETLQQDAGGFELASCPLKNMTSVSNLSNLP